ncbi:MAG: HD-GYP domain-containing protein [Eubacterium sp.]|nr:HD-GYP domain-containing protein [Eubacterium sp.]
MMKKKNKLLRLQEPSKLTYVVLLVLYIAAFICTPLVANSKDVIVLSNGVIPITSLAGVLSAFGNICVNFMILFFKRLGFITSLILLIAQVPGYIINTFFRGNLASLPGLFSGILIFIAIIILNHRNRQLDKHQKAEVENLKEQQKASRRLFEQTATALVNAIDAKDTYSHGHSIRVAEYSRKIAENIGMDEIECQKVFYAGLLHDVGKIGVPNEIINKNGRLTDDEFDIVKQHSVMGDQILSSISEYPFLCVGAHYHHERYDGKGYPDGLKGEDIPEIARIISVADAYDAMSSNRSYRNAIPQQLVREEIVKGEGTQFDPEFAKVMLHLIDLDTDYQMREKDEKTGPIVKRNVNCGEYRSELSDGINITDGIRSIDLEVTEEQGIDEKGRGAAIILFDALDGRVHDDGRMTKEMCYFEYCVIWFNGKVETSGARAAKTEIKRKEYDRKMKSSEITRNYKVNLVKVKDHVLVELDSKEENIQVTVALPDSTRYAYASLSGEHVLLTKITVNEVGNQVAEDYIPRIIEETSYIDEPEGDIPNVQIDGQRTDATEGIKLDGTLEIDFHTKSLPTSRLVWHCPSMVVYTSADGKVNGEGYKEYALIRFDGENTGSDEAAENTLLVNREENFAGWDVWKEKNKAGYESKIVFKRDGNTVVSITDNFGIFINNTTKILGEAGDVYVALTGDQCALTNIRVYHTE